MASKPESLTGAERTLGGMVASLDAAQDYPSGTDHTPVPTATTSITDALELTAWQRPADGERATRAPAAINADATGAPLPASDPSQTIAPPSGAYTPGAPLLPGTKLGERYTVLKLLGRGGMGAVYQAYDDELGVAVAIKTILQSEGSDEHTRRDQVSRFKSELLLARQVTHKNVVRIHDLGHVSDLNYITMTYVAGETLATRLAREGPLPVAQSLALARQVADGMAAAHEVGVVHRDLKPENIMVTPDGHALIMDFGIASSGNSSDGQIVGTIGYMSPEQATGRPVDARADIYAFGLILYDMLLGRHRQQQHGSAIDELRARLEASPPAPRNIREEIPAALNAVVCTATEVSAEKRFANTSALQSALDALTDEGTLRPLAKARARWPAMAASVIVTAVTAAGAWYFLAPTILEAKPPMSVLIADFENRTGDPVFVGVVEQALAAGIEGASFITAFPRRDALRVAATIRPGATLDQQTSRLVALREGVPVVLAGSVEAANGGYRISARALGGANEEPQEIYASSVEADNKGAVLDAVGLLAGEVREALGDTEVGRDGPAAAETFTAASLEAAAAYAKAQELQSAGKTEDAIGQYQETLRLDPELGRAYSGLAVQYTNLSRTAEAERAYQQALARIDRMTDREKFRTRGAYYLFSRKPDLAMQEFSSLVKAFPADGSGLSNLALASFYQRDMAQALEQGRRVTAIFPNNVLRRSNVALYAMYAGRFEDAVTEADAVHQLNPTHLKAFVARALSLLALDRPVEAMASYEQLAQTGVAGASFADAGRADLAHYQGRFTDAAKILEAGIAADFVNKNTAAAAAKQVALAEARLAQGNLAAAAREAQAAADGSTADVVRAGAGLVLAAAGRASQADPLAAALINQLGADPQAYGRLVLAELAMSRKDYRRAVALGREARTIADTWLGRVLLGRAYLGINAYPEAYTELEAALKRKGEASAVFLDEVPTYRHLVPLHFWMGLAQAGLNSPAARESFRTYVTLRQQGDPHLMLEEARQRAAVP